MNKALIHFFDKAFKDGNNTSLAYNTVNGIIVVLILISTLEVILSTEPSFKIYEPYLNLIFLITSCIFLIEYIFRIYIKRKTDEKFKGFKAYKDYLFNFYNLIDFIALIPFFIGLFGLYISPLWKTLRILRIFKILRYFPSVELMVNALKDKKYILLISLQSILFLALLLSIALYYFEHKVATSQFISISQALLWSLAKFIGDIGGYGDFVPVTLIGKVLATLNGFLGIAIFALPAGIIGSGFVEEIEKRQKEKKAIEHIGLVKDVFERDHVDGLTRIKQKYDMETVRRKSLTQKDLRYRLNLTDDDISEMINRQSGLRVRPVITILQDGLKTESIVAEYYHDNRIYGTFTQKNSPITIISPLSNDQPYIGHFTHGIAERLHANYLSVEKFSKSSFNPKHEIDFIENHTFVKEDSPEAIQVFKDDLIALLANTQTVIIFGAKATKGHTFELLNGGKAGDKALLIEESSYQPAETLEKFLCGINKQLSLDGFNMGVHDDYGISSEHHLLHYINKMLGSNVLQINISSGLLKEEKELYYKSIYILSETIKEHFDGKLLPELLEGT